MEFGSPWSAAAGAVLFDESVIEPKRRQAAASAGCTAAELKLAKT